VTNLAAASITVTSATGHQTATLAQRFGSVLDVKRDFGATGLGSLDDGPAIQHALDAIKTGGSARALYFPAGTYLTGQVLYITNTQGVRIFGDGMESTKIQYTGSNTAGNSEASAASSGGGPAANTFTPVIMTNGFSYSSLSGMSLVNQAGSLTVGIYLYQDDTASKGTTEQLNISNVFVYGNSGSIAIGYIIGYPAQHLCSEIMFMNCVVNGATLYGWRNYAFNSLNNNLYNCGGVLNAVWCSIPTGTMNIYGASLAQNTLDIEVGGANGISIAGCRTESVKFIDVGTIGEAIVAINGCTQVQSGDTTTAGFFLNAANGSPVTMIGCRTQATVSNQGKISGSGAQITIIGSFVDGTDPFSGLSSSTLCLINNYFSDTTPFTSTTATIIDLQGTHATGVWTTLSALPAAASYLKGVRSYVTDSTTAATATSFSLLTSTLTGGGSNIVPVWCDGSAWRIG
jgi:hypothetical protein